MDKSPNITAMSTSTDRRTDQQATKASEHLTVRPEGDGPTQVRFMFEQPDGHRIGGALGAGLVTHIIAIVLVLLIASLLPERVYQAVIPPQISDRVVWLSDPGPGGGGGGGNKMPDPPKPAEIVKPKPAPVPAPTPPPPVEPPPVEPITIPIKTLDATVTTPGTIESTQASNTLSTGSGTGTGAGPGQGSGIGDGFGGGTGGGAYRPGNGVLLPKPLREVKPQYTADAMRAKVQGTVLLECVVLPDGTVGKVEVVRSLDSAFGLDQEAIKAAKQWRFVPGTRFGEPVAVLVTIELTFTLR
jgi:protein TonB